MAEKETHYSLPAFVENYEAHPCRLTSSFVANLLEAIDFDELRSRVSDGHLTILDAASGTGAVALAVAQKFPKDSIIATDSSTEMLSMLSKKLKAQDARNIRTHVADLLDHSTLETASVDVIFVNFGIFFVDNSTRSKAWSELARVLKPGGVIAVTCWKHFVVTEWMKSSVLSVDPNYDFNKGSILLSYRLSDAEVIKQEMESSGFSNVVAKVQNHSVMVPRDKFVSLVLPAGVINANFSDEETRKKIFSSAEERFKAEYAGDQSEIAFGGDAWVVSARRRN